MSKRRFLPVDMRDRLKSAFGRGPGGPATAVGDPALPDDTPDYTAIFKARSSVQQASAPIAAMGQAQLAHSDTSDSMSDPEPVAHDIEEAEIVPEPVRALGDSAAWEAQAVTAAEAEEEQPEPMETKVTPSSEYFKREEAMGRKHKNRFADFNATEVVRLKVEKRNNEVRPVEELQPVMVSNDHAQAPVASAPAEERFAASFSNHTEQLETRAETYEESGVISSSRDTTFESASNGDYLKEKPSMDANTHESENGTATIKTDSASNLAAIAIERNSKFSGQLKFSGAVAIDGQVDGELVAERVVVHEGGIVNATIEGNTVIIAGTVKGDIYARNELEILPSGVVHGSVTAPTISVRRGGCVEGRCAIGVPRQ
jgi:cytoskeletal protein CcmA (bactofilin family)